MSFTNLTTSHFIAGYKHHPDQEDVYWLCNHPESLDLIFSKNKTQAFVFDEEQTALTAIEKILVVENHAWYTPVIDRFQPENPSLTNETKPMNPQQAAAKINEYLQLFNERSNSRLELYLTFNKKDNSIRGYGTGLKLGDTVANFVAVLVIKGMKAQCLDQHTFTVKID